MWLRHSVLRPQAETGISAAWLRPACCLHASPDGPAHPGSRCRRAVPGWRRMPAPLGPPAPSPPAESHDWHGPLPSLAHWPAMLCRAWRSAMESGPPLTATKTISPRSHIRSRLPARISSSITRSILFPSPYSRPQNPSLSNQYNVRASAADDSRKNPFIRQETKTQRARVPIRRMTVFHASPASAVSRKPPLNERASQPKKGRSWGQS